MIEYGHDSQGGFYAIDEAERIAYFAYPSSPNADTAKSHVLAPRFVPGWIKAELSYRAAHPEFDWDERFTRMAGNFRAAVSMPYWIEASERGVRCSDCNQLLEDKFHTGVFFHVSPCTRG